MDTRVRQDCLRLAMTEALAYALDSSESLKRAFYQFSEPIVSVETVVSKDIMGYDPSKAKQLFLKMRLISPLFVRAMRDCLESSTISAKPCRARVSGKPLSLSAARAWASKAWA